MTDITPFDIRKPVRTAAELSELDGSEILEGYLDGRAGYPRPGNNRSRAYFHGWRTGMTDSGRMEPDADAIELVRDCKRTGYLSEMFDVTRKQRA